MRKVTLILLPALILLASGCQQEAAQTTDTMATVAPEPAPTDTAALVRDIEAVRDQWVAAAEKDDAATVTALYTADAIIDPPEEPAVMGREAIQAYWLKNFPLSSGLQVRSKETEVSGDLAYDYGEFSQRITPPKGKAMDVQGRYLVVLKRQTDGSWKIDKHFSSPFPPPTKQAHLVQCDSVMKITVQKNGPLRVEGDDIQIQDPSQQAYGLGGRTVVSLCRCGFSANKPFCDGSHNHHGFQDDPQARDLPPKKA